jgi:hypothetical protein
MKRMSLVLLLLVMSAGLLGCPSKGEPRRDVYSDPDAARARGAERTQELDRNIQK